ncbi:MAG: hypothetical protein IPL52_07170 [Flavobacteriales bacterium]|nr:hypothetical protein [Flavobacteriales bacterium]
MSFNRWCLLIAVLVYLTAAWFGLGYHAEDEFQQVILIAEHLRGHVDAASLPLDYHAHWRSMVQPLLCAGVFEVCEAIGISDPFQLTLALRLLTALLALWITHGFVGSVQANLKSENQQAFKLLSYFLWFLPVLQIRFTGEAWSGLLFLRGLGMLMDPNGRKAWAIGAWFGAAVLFRPAAALLPFGALLWMVFVQRTRRNRTIALTASMAVVLLLGVMIDSMLYRSATSTLLNYMLAAFTGEEAARFTALPWYQYALFTLKHAVVPIGALLMFAFALVALLRSKHVLAWVLIPFLIVHSLLPVKELRFLFPLAPLMPLVLITAWEALQDRWPGTMARTIWLRLLFPFAALNALALFVAAVTPAGNGKIELAQAARERFGTEAVQIEQMADWRPWIPPFFLAPGSTETFSDKIIVDPNAKPNQLVMAYRSQGFDRIANLERLAVATPGWADRLFAWYKLEDAHDPLVLYHITTQRTGH